MIPSRLTPGRDNNTNIIKTVALGLSHFPSISGHRTFCFMLRRRRWGEGFSFSNYTVWCYKIPYTGPLSLTSVPENLSKENYLCTFNLCKHIQNTYPVIIQTDNRQLALAGFYFSNLLIFNKSTAVFSIVVFPDSQATALSTTNIRNLLHI